MGANYIIVDSVGHGRATLSLRQRTDLGPPFFLMAWREQRPDGRNRRFYFEKGAVWQLDSGVALALMEQAAARDLLNTRYDDPFHRWGGGTPRFLVSQELSPPSRAQVWDEITLSAGEAEWGPDPYFVVGIESRGIWRKVMLVSTQCDSVTFRSCTADPSHAHPKNMGKGLPWMLDNTMMDCSVQIMREFLRRLKASK